MKKFQNMEHSNSRTFQGLSRALNFFSKIQGLSRTSQGPYKPCVKETCTRVGTVQREWQTSCCCARNCDELASNFPCMFLVQVIAQASPAYISI